MLQLKLPEKSKKLRAQIDMAATSTECLEAYLDDYIIGLYWYVAFLISLSKFSAEKRPSALPNKDK